MADLPRREGWVRTIRTDEDTQMTVWAAPAAPDLPLPHRATAEVVVVGAGIVGLSLATMLADRGADVLVVARHPVGEGVSGRSTAKVTALHQLRYAELAARHGADAARTYADACTDAARWVAAHAGEAFQARPAQTVARTPEEDQQLQEEADAALAAGLPVELRPADAFPGATHALALTPDQGQVEPVVLLRRLADGLRERGVAVHTATVRGVRDGTSGVTVRADEGDVRARHAVLATGLPITDRGGFFALCEPSASYLVAIRQDPTSVPDEAPMMITASSPTRSVRWTADDTGPIVLVGGEGHRPGTGRSARDRCDALERWARERIDGLGATLSRWGAEDYISPDLLPFAGPQLRVGGSVHVITGLSKWGFTLGVACADALTERLLDGRSSAFASLVDTARLPDVPALATIAKANAEVAQHMVAGWARALSRGGTTLGCDHGGVVGRCGLQLRARVAVDGEEHDVSGVCTHLGGIVAYNEVDRTWDCPLHGSRFEADGDVRHGPAIRTL